MAVISPNAVRASTKRETFRIADPDRFTIDDLLEMTTVTMNRTMKAFSEEHKQALLVDCVQRIEFAQMRVCGVGQEASDSRGVTRFPNPYTLLKKYSYMYTCLSGWQSESDLLAREQAMYEEHGMTEAQKQAFRDKGWLKD